MKMDSDMKIAFVVVIWLLVQMVLILLKLGGVFDISWSLVLLPILPLVFLGILVIAYFLFLFLMKGSKR